MSAVAESTTSLLATVISWASSISLAIAIICATYITSFCFTAPNAASYPNTNTKSDTQAAFKKKLIVYYLCTTIVLVTGLYHAVISLNYPLPPSSLLCSNPTNLAPGLFTWNPFSISCMVFMFCAGHVLIQCFVQAGPSSNFEITMPKQLVTTGIYSWIQHPAYVASFVIFLVNVAYFQRIDGVLGCWLPEHVVRSQVFGVGVEIWSAYVVVGSLGLWIMLWRVRSEESMLGKTFGAKWVDYNLRTKRFIPWVI